MMAGNPTPRPYWTPDAPVIRLTEQERTSYREQIRELVTGASLTFTWLIRQLSDEGLMTDKYEMSATLSGVRRRVPPGRRDTYRSYAVFQGAEFSGSKAQIRPLCHGSPGRRYDCRHLCPPG